MEGKKETPLPGLHSAECAAETTLLHADENNDRESVHFSLLSHQFVSTDFHQIRGENCLAQCIAWTGLCRLDHVMCESGGRLRLSKRALTGCHAAEINT